MIPKNWVTNPNKLAKLQTTLPNIILSNLKIEATKAFKISKQRFRINLKDIFQAALI